ncbi:carbohydrate ABC transporter permease [Salinibacillus xinjiangensis]|uniref:ABC transporter permease subunit n=1 Tax=Salinibacillus xinjiangensis TaxID=1229268 RepID=A0A6G1XAF5_9BACI|nr:sugar ABC transporter permease [Salinibacillus xinjiangensis]MRG87860.1 ABC transporter permease subunit [Salinibacillus xinjiangensis]
MTPKLKKTLIYLSFVLPALIFFTLVIIIPFSQAIIYSFQEWNGISASTKWVGLDNYIALFSDKDFISSLWITAKFVILTVIGVNVTGFLLALVLNKALKSRNILRTLFFMPNVIGSLIIGFIWQFIFTQVFNQIYGSTGWSFFEINWLTLPDSAFYALVLVFSWQFVGYVMVIYLAALQGVPKELVESSYIDGASGWDRLRYIVLPLIMPAITISTFLAAAEAFKMYDLNLSLTNGGPFNSTEMLALQIYQEAFVNNQYGFGSAQAVVFFMMVALITLGQVALMKRKEVDM